MPEHSRSKLVKIIETGEVLVNGKVAKSSLALKPGDVVEMEAPAETPAHDLTPVDRPLEVIYEDEVMLVVNKPRGLATHPATSLKEPSLVNVLLGRNEVLSQAAGSFRPGIVHRLDKDTTGLLLVAKNDAAHVALAKQIEHKTAERRYFAIVRGDLTQERFRVDAPLARDPKNRLRMAVNQHGRHALTHGKRVKALDSGTLVALRLETGRTHQIRVHLAAIGHSVLGDNLYSPQPSPLPMQLHAAYLEVTHPDSGERMKFFVAPDQEFLGWEFALEEAIEPW